MIRFSKVTMLKQLNIDSQPEQVSHILKLEEMFKNFNEPEKGKQQDPQYTIDMESLKKSIAKVALNPQKELDEDKIALIQSWLTNTKLKSFLKQIEPIYKFDKYVLIRGYWEDYLWENPEANESEKLKQIFFDQIVTPLLKFGTLKPEKKRPKLKKVPQRVVQRRMRMTLEDAQNQNEIIRIRQENKEKIKDFVNSEIPISIKSGHVIFKPYNKDKQIDYIQFRNGEIVLCIGISKDTFHFDYKDGLEDPSYPQKLIKKSSNEIFQGNMEQIFNICGYKDLGEDNFGFDLNKNMIIKMPTLEIQCDISREELNFQFYDTLIKFENYAQSIVEQLHNFLSNFSTNEGIDQVIIFKFSINSYYQLSFNIDEENNTNRRSFLLSIILYQIFSKIDTVIIHDQMVDKIPVHLENGKLYIKSSLMEFKMQYEMLITFGKLIIQQFMEVLNQPIHNNQMSLLDFETFRNMISCLNISKALSYFKSSIQHLDIEQTFFCQYIFISYRFKFEVTEFMDQINEIMKTKEQNPNQLGIPRFAVLENEDFIKAIFTVIQLPITLKNITEALKILQVQYPNFFKGKTFNFFLQNDLVNTNSDFSLKKIDNYYIFQLYRHLPLSRQEIIEELHKMIDIEDYKTFNGIPTNGLRLIPFDHQYLMNIICDMKPKFQIRRTRNFQGVAIPTINKEHIQAYAVQQDSNTQIEITQVEVDNVNNNEVTFDIQKEQFKPGLYTLLVLLSNKKIILHRDIFINFSVYDIPLYDSKVMTTNDDTGYSKIVNQQKKYGIFECTQLMKIEQKIKQKCKILKEPVFGFKMMQNLTETKVKIPKLNKIRFLQDHDIIGFKRTLEIQFANISIQNLTLTNQSHTKYHCMLTHPFVDHPEDREFIDKHEPKPLNDNIMKQYYCNYFYCYRDVEGAVEYR